MTASGRWPRLGAHRPKRPNVCWWARPPEGRSSSPRRSARLAGRRGVTSEVRGGLGAPGHLELRQDAGHVVLHGLLGESQVLADLLVGLPVRDLREDTLLLRREPGQFLVPHEVLALAE